MTNKERAKIVEDRMKLLAKERHALRKELRTHYELIDHQVNSEGHTRTEWVISADKLYEYEYKIRLLAIQMIALREELCRVDTREESQ